MLLNAGFAHSFEQKIQGLSRTHFPFFKDSIPCEKKPNESMSFLVLPQHEQFYPEVVSLFVFAELDKVSTEI